LSRNLKLIEEQQLVVSGADPDDRRVRMVRITEAGAARLGEAVPCWRQAQAKVEETLGLQATLSLNGLLDLCSAKLAG
jgi:DNA-binding MarR family transcriptional regulator